MPSKKIPLVCTLLLARGLPVYRLFHSTVDYRVGHNSPCIAAPTGVRLSRAKFRDLSSTFTFPRVSSAITFHYIRKRERCGKSKKSGDIWLHSRVNRSRNCKHFSLSSFIILNYIIAVITCFKNITMYNSI